MTQADFARKSGWSKRMISHYCNDDRLMSVEAMYTAAVILEIPMEQLYQWKISAD
jgi:transcriptional regulator with XRE-family HTH domain